MKDTLTYHLCGLPHTQYNRNFNACAFTMKGLRTDEALHKRGHKGYVYGNAGSKTFGEFIEVVPQEFFDMHYGRNVKDRDKVYDIHEYSDFTRTFIMNMCSQIRLRARPGDIVLDNYGAWTELVVDMLRDIEDLVVCEFSVGYGGSIFAPFRVFESYSNQESHKGAWNQSWNQWDNVNKERSEQGLEELDAPMDAIHNTSPQPLDDVINMYLDPREFNYLDNTKGEKEDYNLYLGRIQWSKGIDLAIKTCERLGEKLLIVGQCATSFEEELGYPVPDFVELYGHADAKERKVLMSKAKIGWVPTYYSEPGGHVLIEYLLSGTPIITTDWGNMPNVNVNGVVGYRVRSGREAELAVKQITRGDILSYHCRKWAMNFTMDRQARAYEYYFRRVRDYVLDKDENKDDIWYNQSDVDLSIRDLIHPFDPRYDINLEAANESLCPESQA